MDKAIKYAVIVIILAVALFWGFRSGFFANIFSNPDQPTPLPQGIVLFYGQGCPHCIDVENFVKANNIEEKVNFTKLEVWYNKNNAALLGQVAQMCKITTSSVGVPFLYDGKNCLIGGPDVINFFKAQAGIK